MRLVNLTTRALPRDIMKTSSATLASNIVAFLTALAVLPRGPNGFILPFLAALNIAAFILNAIERKNQWDALRPYIEELVNQKIQAHHLKTINSNLRGLVENMAAVRRVHKQFNEAPPQDRERQGELLRSHHNAFLMFLRASIPHFQIKEHAVVSLTDFAMAANIHIIMLSEALKNGTSWGYTTEYLSAIRAELNEKTGLGTKVPAVPLQRGGAALPGTGDSIASRGVRHRLQMQLLFNTIQQGETEGWSAELVDTWKYAYSALGVQRREVSSAAGSGNGTAGTKEDLDYPTYVRNTYEHGRQLVRRYNSGPGNWPGRKIADVMRAYADYDAIMIARALSFAEYWPYLTGEFEVPDRVYETLDREIYSGPYGRGADWVPWSKTQPPPVTARIGNITSLIVRAGRSIDGFRLESGGHWGYYYGSETKGRLHRIDLGPDELIDNVDLTFGDKVGSLTFLSNKAKYGPYGSPRHTTTKPAKWKQALLHNATLGLSVNHTGYSLSSVHCTRRSDLSPSGCEGIFFGFRPSYIAADDYEPVQNVTAYHLAPLADLKISDET
ncbi:hypothetical protein MY11210_004187 [Beauveria gryllotalpidicola]